MVALRADVGGTRWLSTRGRRRLDIEHYEEGGFMASTDRSIPDKPSFWEKGSAGRALGRGAGFLTLLVSLVIASALSAQNRPGKIRPPHPPRQFDKAQPTIQLVEATKFIQAAQARNEFKVSGKG